MGIRKIVQLQTLGLVTNRDAWNHNFSRETVESNYHHMVDFYNQQLDICWSDPTMSPLKKSARTALVKQLVDRDPRKFSWTNNAFDYIAANRRIQVVEGSVRSSTYRPFVRSFLNFSAELNERRGKHPTLFPESQTENLVICVINKQATAPFSALICREVPDLVLMGAGNVVNCFPRYIYSEEKSESDVSLFDRPTEERRHGVTEAAQNRVSSLLGTEVSKDEIFFYVYGILHSSEYRETFAADFKKDVPRIPYVEDTVDFFAFASAGRALADIHLGYESIDPWPDLEIKYSSKFNSDSPESYRVEKMKYPKTGRETDRTTIIYNSNITISSIPLEAHDYTLGSKSALDWIVERYQVKTDKDSGIVNDPNDWATEHDDPTYIFDLVRRIVTVSMRTNEIVASLPSLNL
jgi:predicted helicase